MTTAPPAVLIGGFLIALLIAISFFWISPVLAIPMLVIGLLVIGLLDMRRRRRHTEEIKDFRDQAKAEEVEFSDRDRETLVEG